MHRRRPAIRRATMRCTHCDDGQKIPADFRDSGGRLPIFSCPECTACIQHEVIIAALRPRLCGRCGGIGSIGSFDEQQRECPQCGGCGGLPGPAQFMLKRLQELVTDDEVQNFPETHEGGLTKLLEMRNYITQLGVGAFRPRLAQRQSLEPDAWQYRFNLAGQWNLWKELDYPLDRFKEKFKFNFDNGTCELRP